MVLRFARLARESSAINKSKEIHYLLPLIQIVNKLINNDETRDDNNNGRVTT